MSRRKFYDLLNNTGGEDFLEYYEEHKLILRLEDNITKYYPQQIAIFKERINGFTADMQKYEQNKPWDKEQFSMAIGEKHITIKRKSERLLSPCVKKSRASMPAQLKEAQTKLSNVEHQLETARAEVI